MKNLTLPQAIVACVAILVLGALAWRTGDSTGLLLVVVGLLGIGGAGALSTIREQTNGDKIRMANELAEHRQLIGELAKTLATMTPPAPPGDQTNV